MVEIFNSIYLYIKVLLMLLILLLLQEVELLHSKLLKEQHKSDSIKRRKDNKLIRIKGLEKEIKTPNQQNKVNNNYFFQLRTSSWKMACTFNL